MSTKTRTIGERMASSAVLYMTVGGLLVIWSGLWLVYLTNHPPTGDMPYYVSAGLLLSGLGLMAVASMSGRLGRSARQADANPDAIGFQAAAPSGPIYAAQPPPEHAFPVRESTHSVVG